MVSANKQAVVALTGYKCGDTCLSGGNWQWPSCISSGSMILHTREGKRGKKGGSEGERKVRARVRESAPLQDLKVHSAHSHSFH